MFAIFFIILLKITFIGDGWGIINNVWEMLLDMFCILAADLPPS